MIQIAIIEDDPADQEILRNFLIRYGNETRRRFDISAFHDGIDIVEEDTTQFGIIFLDIQMALMDGMTSARKIRERNIDSILFFVTSLAQYATEGYEVSASGYLLKPIRYETLSKYMDRACGELERRDDRYLTLVNSRELQKINLRNVIYLIADGHSVLIHMKNGVISIPSSIRDMEKKLAGESFFRCNSGIIVNLEYVESVSQYDVVVAGEKLSISRPKKRPLLEALAEYIGG